MESREIENLVSFHQSGLDQYRQVMSVSAQYLEEQTVKALKEFGHLVALKEQASDRVRIAKNILSSKQ